jgi:hypothetical protein
MIFSGEAQKLSPAGFNAASVRKFHVLQAGSIRAAFQVALKHRPEYLA